MPPSSRSSRSTWVAVAGCVHGELDTLYRVFTEQVAKRGIRCELLLCCGDFQCVRGGGGKREVHADLACVACPPKYRREGDFPAYYRGEKRAPVTTVFIGGNHEASNYLQELPLGGWVAPNIFYLGHAGALRVGVSEHGEHGGSGGGAAVATCRRRRPQPRRRSHAAGARSVAEQRDERSERAPREFVIAGLSGIYKQHDYEKTRDECVPYTDASLRSAYHVRRQDVCALEWFLRDARDARRRGTTAAVDVFLSHDWPAGIVHYGDVRRLLRHKPYLAADIESGRLGSPPSMQLLMRAARPRYWFAAHMHCRFDACVPRRGAERACAAACRGGDAPRRCADDVVDDGDEDDAAAMAAGPADTEVRSRDGAVKFIALDKVVPGRPFLTFTNLFDGESPVSDDDDDDDDGAVSPSIQYLALDANWLRAVQRLYGVRADATEHIDIRRALRPTGGDDDGDSGGDSSSACDSIARNPQTMYLLERLHIPVERVYALDHARVDERGYPRLRGYAGYRTRAQG